MEPIKAKTRMGHPPKPIGEKQSKRIAVNLTPGEYDAVARAARCADLSLSAFMQSCWRAVSGFKGTTGGGADAA